MHPVLGGSPRQNVGRRVTDCPRCGRARGTKLSATAVRFISGYLTTQGPRCSPGTNSHPGCSAAPSVRFVKLPLMSHNAQLFVGRQIRESVLPRPHCLTAFGPTIEILDEAGFLHTSGFGGVNLVDIPNGLSAKETETFLRESGAQICGPRLAPSAREPGDRSVEPSGPIGLSAAGTTARAAAVTVELL
jgi:hypothetical protein